MPIVHILPNTKIIHLGQAVQSIPAGDVSQNQVAMPTVTAPTPAQPSCSGMNTNEVQHQAMEVENAATGNNHADAATPVAPATITAAAPMQSQRAPRETFTAPRVLVQPKKGVNTKNRQAKPPGEVEGVQQDPTLNERMSILAEITKLMKASYGTRRNEVEGSLHWPEFR